MALPLCQLSRKKAADPGHGLELIGWAHPGWVRLAHVLCTGGPSLVMKHHRLGMTVFSVSRQVSAHPESSPHQCITLTSSPVRFRGLERKGLRFSW